MAALSLARGELLAGGLILLVSLPLDALDGAVARAMGRAGAFGMVLDSTLDRYADGLIFGALGYYFALRRGGPEMLALALAALVGSYLVSYVRARADDSRVGVSTTVGLFTRLERVVVILINDDRQRPVWGRRYRLRSASWSWRWARISQRCSAYGMSIRH